MNKELYGEIERKEGAKYSIIASTNAKDRDGEIIMPSSVKNLSGYLAKNPVILWAHDYSKPPIGKAVSGKITENAVVLEIEFAETEFAKEIKYLYDNKFLNAFSIGFIPKEWDRNSDGDLVYTEIEIIETSSVPVPANAEANMIRACKDAGNVLTEYKKILNISEVVGEKLDAKAVTAKKTDNEKIKIMRS